MNVFPFLSSKFLRDLPERETAKAQPKKWQKMSKISGLLRNTLSTFQALVADEEESDEDKYPKVDVENVYPSAFSPEEVSTKFVWCVQKSHCINWYDFT